MIGDAIGVEAPAPHHAPAALEWSFSPWRERPLAAAAAGILTLALCVAVALANAPLILSLALALAGASALSPALSPLVCRIDEDGVARRGPLGWERRRWREIRRAALVGAGLLVSPYAERSWLDPYRGLFLPLPAAARARLVPGIRPHLENHGL